MAVHDEKHNVIFVGVDYNYSVGVHPIDIKYERGSTMIVGPVRLAFISWIKFP